jgi:hypothetical protein
LASGFDAKFRCVLNQPIAYLDGLYVGHGKTQALTQSGGQKLVRKYTDVLGVVAKFDYVVATVRSAHQLRLCSAAHSTDMLHGLKLL